MVKHLVLLISLILAVGSENGNAQEYRTYRGCIHIHSIYSDGSGTVGEIMAAARNAGLDFAIMSDHNTLQPLQDGYEGWHEGVLLLIGTELSLPNGHYLALNVPPDFTWDEEDSQRAIDQVNAAGGFGFMAHPDSRWPWTDWEVTGYTGIELTNLSSLFHQEGLAQPLRLLVEFVADYFTDSTRALQRVMSVASDGSLERWAELLQERPVVGLGSVDAHARIEVAGAQYNVPPYNRLFESLQMHIIVPRTFNRTLAHDKALVYDALREGRCYTAFTIWGDPMGFEFSASRSGASAVMGQRISRNGGLVNLRVKVPGNESTRMRIYRDSRQILTTSRRDITLPTPIRGTYRVEVDRLTDGRQVPWVISNPIYVE